MMSNYTQEHNMFDELNSDEFIPEEYQPDYREDESDGQPDEAQEWFDYDPDC